MKIINKSIPHIFRNKYLKNAGGSINIFQNKDTSNTSITDSWFYKDTNGNVHSKFPFIGDSEICAYGQGTIDSGDSSVLVYDGLDSTNPEIALSANQGRVLKDMIDTKTVDLSNYYTSDQTDQKIAELVDGAPETLDTLNELAVALKDNKDAVDAINSAITNKADKIHTHTKSDITDLDLSAYDNHLSDSTIHITNDERASWNNKIDKSDGKGLSTNDFTTDEKNKLKGIEAGAQVNTVTSVAGKIGDVTLSKADVGLGSVDNTADANKSVNYAATAGNATNDGNGNTIVDTYLPFSGGTITGDLTLNNSLVFGDRCMIQKESYFDKTSQDLNFYGDNYYFNSGDVTINDNLNISANLYFEDGVHLQERLDDNAISYLNIDSGSKLDVNSDLNVSGNILATGEITAYSDARLKSNIKPLENRGVIEPKVYIKDGKQSIGFLAQDVQKLYPELVSEDSTKEKYLSLNYAQYTAVLQAQIIELNEKINELQNLIENGNSK